MPGLLQRTLDAGVVGRLHNDLRASIRPQAEDAPCIGSKVAALQMAVRDLLTEHPDDLAAEARTILRDLAPLSFRCRDLWRAQ